MNTTKKKFLFSIIFNYSFYCIKHWPSQCHISEMSDNIYIKVSTHTVLAFSIKMIFFDAVKSIHNIIYTLGEKNN